MAAKYTCTHTHMWLRVQNGCVSMQDAVYAKRRSSSQTAAQNNINIFVCIFSTLQPNLPTKTSLSSHLYRLAVCEREGGKKAKLKRAFARPLPENCRLRRRTQNNQSQAQTHTGTTTKITRLKRKIPIHPTHTAIQLENGMAKCYNAISPPLLLGGQPKTQLFKKKKIQKKKAKE